MKPLIQLFCSSGLAAFICWLKLKQLQASRLITVQNIIGFMKFGSYHLEKGEGKEGRKVHNYPLWKYPESSSEQK